ncbi:DUF3467 domain-containing protein [Oceanomicrobium pacificus]|uniref:DUF3467 domain-containing protein n=1 Tax=Oceanomicrobium pacificus TaxID=2692916 RepID=A0A6B0TVA3_9RHOB|nr:DUF3467 domain-containing protein [Oceanomicrobium pacificus]MXU66699.1 DUF3467 domain-containing protein [Oceanomicrobium pacificus]
MVDETADGGAQGAAATGAGAAASDPKSKVNWDDSAMETAFANVVNIQGTREQIELFFGTNRTWNVAPGRDVHVDLTNRMILTPYAAKRLNGILTRVLREYEARHGVLKVDDA